MPQEVTGERFGIGRHVEHFARRHAGQLARGDVAHRVAARLAGGDAGVGEAAHRRLDIVQPDEVELHVLPGRDVSKAARELVGDIRQHVELIGGENALRNLHANHLRIVDLTLPVAAAHEAKRAPLVRGDLTALESGQGRGELVDIGLVGKRQSGTAVGGRIVKIDGHGILLSAQRFHRWLRARVPTPRARRARD